MHLSELVEEYRLYARAANRSQHTIDSYANAVKGFVRFLESKGYGTDCETITARVIREYVTELQTGYETDGKKHPPSAPQTIAKKLQVLKTLYAFGVREELIDSDPTLRVAIPKVPKEDYEVFSDQDVEALLRACDTATLHGVRDFAIVYLLFDSGIRATELTSLSDAAIDWTRGLITVCGKGDRERAVPVSARTLRAIRRYQTRRDRAGYSDPPALFVNNIGQPLTRSGLYQLLERMGSRAGLHTNPHRFRHSMACAALRNGASLADIQDQLGHTTLNMTRHYARQSAVDLARQHRRFSPADKLRVRV